MFDVGCEFCVIFLECIVVWFVGLVDLLVGDLCLVCGNGFYVGYVYFCLVCVVGLGCVW